MKKNREMDLTLFAELEDEVNLDTLYIFKVDDLVDDVDSSDSKEKDDKEGSEK